MTCHRYSLKTHRFNLVDLQARRMMMAATAVSPCGGRLWLEGKVKGGGMMMVVRMRDRSKNRKALQKGRNLSIEAIQAVQALKRAFKPSSSSSSSSSSDVLEKVMDSKLRRLLKLDMMAVLKELLRQNQCFLALKVFEDIRKEYWYKPQVSLYADIISVMADNGLSDEVKFLYSTLKAENCLEPEIEGFNSLLETLINHKFSQLVMDCYDLMKSVGCEPDRVSFRILVNGLESIGEMGLSEIVRQDACSYYGELLDFLKAEEEISSNCGS